MKERDIRPQDLLMEVLKIHKEDVSDMMKHEEEFIKVACPCCEEGVSTFQYEKEGFKFVKCNKCNTIYINPRPTSQMLSDFYANSRSMKYWNEVLFPETEEFRKEKLFKNRAQNIIKFCEKYGENFRTIVDVGAGFGTFCDVIKENNTFENVIAVEPSTGLAKTCENKGIQTINESIENVLLENISVITSFEVIEHLFNPIEFVKECANVLPKNGLFIVTTPNMEGFELSMLKTVSPNIGGPDHLNYFTPSSLEYLLEKCGFEVLEVTTPGKLDAELVRKEILNDKLDIEKESFIYTILIEKWNELGEEFQEFLAEHKLSSHMWAVAKKK
ncbi:class I SAM-dependent methyltransferase [Clostridium sp. LCP25S3_F8]|uniref:class I SAM-dependent methyltransferase n=1 Tax=Clostridium sp. LCP25S3_F8 TaxID=3438751 RepID=UPI003F9270A6